MTRIVAIPLGYILELLYNFLGNYGLTIILFTVIIRLIIFPLYAAQMKSSRQMMKIQPKIKEIQTAYAGNPEKMNEKMQEIYSENKIHPAMGCLPLLIQLPVIWGLFGLLRSPLKYLGDNVVQFPSGKKFKVIEGECYDKIIVNYQNQRLGDVRKAELAKAANPA